MSGRHCRRSLALPTAQLRCLLHSRESLRVVLRIICLPVSCRPALGLLAIVAFSCSLHMMWLLSVFLSVCVWVWRCQPHSWGASLHSREQPLARHLRRSSIPAGAPDILFARVRCTCYSLHMPREEAETVLTRDDLRPSHPRPFVC